MYANCANDSRTYVHINTNTFHTMPETIKHSFCSMFIPRLSLMNIKVEELKKEEIKKNSNITVAH